MLAETRRRGIADRLRQTGAVTVAVAEFEERFGVSSMTARRDLAELERRGVVRRTHAGVERDRPDRRHHDHAGHGRRRGAGGGVAAGGTNVLGV